MTGLLVLLLPLLPLRAAQASPGEPVVVGINTDFPPYEYLDGKGDPRGFDVELLQAAAGATGLTIRFRPGPWEQIRADLEAGRIGMLAGMLRSRERERYADFSTPCLRVLYGIFVRKDGTAVRGLEDLRGRKILVERGSQMHEHLRALGFQAEIVPVESEPAALRRLARGWEDAALVPLLTGAMEVRDARLSNVRSVGEAVYSRDLCFAVTRGDQALLDRLNTGLAILNQNGEYARIYQKWFGELERARDTLPALLKRTAWVLLPLLLLTAGAIGWTWILRRQVLARTRELRSANHTLAEKERFLQAVVDNLPVAVFGKDPNRNFAYTVWNKRCEELFGLKAEEVLGTRDGDFEPPEVAALFRRTDERTIARRARQVIPDDFAHDRHRGMLLLHTVKVPIFDESGSPWMVLAISEDVTQRRWMEAALLHSQESLAEAQRIARMGSWEWDPATGRVHWSDEFCRLLELEPGATPPGLRPLLRRSHPDDRQAVAGFLRQALRGGVHGELDHRLLLPGRGLRHVHSTFEASASGLLGTLQDTTERRQAEEALWQAQKLEGLGVLAGGIAHDFNNLLSAILANLNLAQTAVQEDSKTARYLQSMEKAVVRASDLTRQMLAYSGRGAFVIQSLDLNQVTEEITQLLKASISKKVAIRFELQAGLPRIEADVAQIQQVIMNLVTNASEAIGDREGTITLRTRRLDMDRASLERHFPGQAIQAGSFALLEVADTGCGMDARTREHLFEPFFTTKFSGRGLGLSAILGILKGHRAGILIDSEPGRGSSFRVYFPAREGTREAPAGPGDAAGEPPLPTGTILLVDDEEVVRTATRAMLAELGCPVLEASDGREALELFGQRRHEIALVLLDLTMPRMDGHETLRELRRIEPGVRVILCSGYHAQEALRGESAPDELVGFLHKPFSLQDLRTALRGMNP